MNTFFTKNFKKNFNKRIKGNKSLENRFKERYDLFTDDSSNEVLNDHQLSGKLQGYRAFSITGDIRVVYYARKETAFFVDIGTHNQVYGN